MLAVLGQPCVTKVEEDARTTPFVDDNSQSCRCGLPSGTDDVPMATAVRPRLLLAVSPPLLADSLARVLALDGSLDVVVHVEGRSAGEAGTPLYDIGVVTSELPGGVQVRVVIQLPAALSGSGVGRVRTGLSEREVPIRDITSIRRLIDELGDADVVAG